MKLKLVNGLMFALVLYLLIDKYKNKKSCACKEEETPAVIAPITTENPDPILDSTNVIEPINEIVEPSPICPFTAFVLYIGFQKLIIQCVNNKPRAAIYELRKDSEFPLPIGGSLRYLDLTNEQVKSYMHDFQNGKNTDFKNSINQYR